MMLLVSQHNRETVAHEEQDKQHKGNEVGNGQSNDEVELIVSWREDGDLRDHHREHVQNLGSERAVLLRLVEQAVLDERKQECTTRSMRIIAGFRMVRMTFV